MVIDDFEEPDLPRIVAEIIKDVVDIDRVGVRLVDTADEFNREYTSFKQGYTVPEQHYVMLRRLNGYIDNNTFTDISGLEVTVFTKTRSECVKLMSEITKAIMRSETQSYLGFNIDFVAVLNGPNPDPLQTMDDNVLQKSFEFHIRVKWL